MTQHALAIQEGGTHYKGMGMQPIEFGYANRYDPAAFSAMKYVSRHRAKNGLEDLKKGRHFILLRRDLRREHPSNLLANAFDNVPVEDYIKANSFEGIEAAILVDLHCWACGKTGLPDVTIADFLVQKFDLLMDSAYPKSKD